MVGCAKVKIAKGAALSDAVDLNQSRLVGLMLPDGWDTADVTFQVSIDGATYVDLFTPTAEFKIATGVAAASRQYILDIHETPGIRFLKVRSGVAATPVNQSTGERVITLILCTPGLV